MIGEFTFTLKPFNHTKNLCTIFKDKIKCENCGKHSFGEAANCLTTRLYQHKQKQK